MNVQTKELQAGGQMPDLGTDPIPAAPYYDPAYFELEREAIFRRTWLQIGHACEVAEPGSFIARPVEVAHASILIVRGKDGKIRAFHNACTHRGTQLVDEASGSAARFTCRYHAWTFGLDGALKSAPDFERFYVDKASCSLREVHVDVCAGLIFVNLADEPEQSLSEFLGPLAAQLEALPVARATTFAEYVYEIDANWKLTYDNFQENYHLRFIHPRSGAAAAGPDNPFGYPARYGFHDPHRTQTIWVNPDAVPTPVQAFAFGKAYEFAMADGFGVTPDSKDYFGLFPNFFLFGSPTQHFSHTVMPVAADRSRGIFRFYWIGEDNSATKRFAREYAMATGRDIHSEDRAVIVAGQRGLSSGALKHIHFQEQEVLCRHFFKQVDSRVQAYKASLEHAGNAA
jgi:phenylpropionate dioxygenase-like ring-hydroxylating dioxygenase large terminal subunit